MENLVLTHNESFVFPQSPLGQRYADIAERKLRKMSGFVKRSEDTISVKVSYSFTGSLQVPEDGETDMKSMLEAAEFEL